MSYSHAAALSGSRTPREKMTFLVTELGRWAALNPGLRPLHEEFVLAVSELKPPEPAAPEVVVREGQIWAALDVEGRTLVVDVIQTGRVVVTLEVLTEADDREPPPGDPRPFVVIDADTLRQKYRLVQEAPDAI